MRFSTLFLLSLIAVLLSAFVVAALAGHFTLKAVDHEKTQRELVRQMGFLEAALSQSHDWQKLADGIQQRNAIRITVIDESGQVVVESSLDREQMDNHLGREEIRLARSLGEGFSTRYSDSTRTDHIYFARWVNLKDTGWFLRVAIEQEVVQSNFAALWQRVLAVFVIALMLSIWLAAWLNRLMSVEVKQLAWLYRAIDERRSIDPAPRFWVSEFDQMGQAAVRLSRRLAKREKKKKTYQAKIRLKNRQQSEVLSAISHEFKNPIAIIQGYSQTLIDDTQMQNTMRTRFLQKIHNSAQKLTAMLDRFILATRLESDDFQPRVSEVDLLEVARECVYTFGDRYPQRQVLLEGFARTVQADRMLLEMVISNLIENALKYSSQAVIVQIESDAVSVIDKGIGIEPDELKKVTEKFYRASKLGWDNSMGLGLAIVNFALRRHGTTLEIESRVGEGSVFRFKI